VRGPPDQWQRWRYIFVAHQLENGNDAVKVFFWEPGTVDKDKLRLGHCRSRNP